MRRQATKSEGNQLLNPDLDLKCLKMSFSRLSGHSTLEIALLSLHFPHCDADCEIELEFHSSLNMPSCSNAHDTASFLQLPLEIRTQISGTYYAPASQEPSYLTLTLVVRPLDVHAIYTQPS